MSERATVIRTDDLKENDIIIALMGPTGTGKSTFIDVATLQNGKTVGHHLKSQTSDIRIVKFPHPETRQRIILVDTPGFNDTNKSDTEILTLIANWLQKTYKDRVKLTGIIYLHRITDNRMGGSPLKNLKMFAHLCGDQAVSRVVLCTTMWGRLKGTEVGASRENELKGQYWKPMLDHGSKLCRFEATFPSAWKIVNSLIENGNSDAAQLGPVLLQEELVDMKKRLSETEAGRTLYTDLQRLLVEQKEVIRKMRDDAAAEDNPELAREYAQQFEKLEQQLQSTFDQIQKLKIPLSRRILRMFMIRRPRGRVLSIMAA